MGAHPVLERSEEFWENDGLARASKSVEDSIPWHSDATNFNHCKSGVVSKSSFPWFYSKAETKALPAIENVQQKYSDHYQHWNVHQHLEYAALRLQVEKRVGLGEFYLNSMQ